MGPSIKVKWSNWAFFIFKETFVVISSLLYLNDKILGSSEVTFVWVTKTINCPFLGPSSFLIVIWSLFNDWL